MKLLKKSEFSFTSLLFGFIFSFSNLICILGKNYKDFTNSKGMIVFGLSILLTPIISLVYTHFYKLLNKHRNIFNSTNNINTTTYFIIVWIIHVLCYLPVFLAYYPGIFAYDVNHQLSQYINGFNAKHPLSHTLYLVFFYYYLGKNYFNNVMLSIGLASLVQMIIFAATISYSYLFLYKLKVNKTIRLMLILFSSLFPVFSVLSISLTKDIFFSGFVLLFITSMLEQIFGVDNKLTNIVFCVSIIGIILFRNNGVYPLIIIIVYYLFLLIFKKYQHPDFKKIVLCVILALLINNGLAYKLHAREGSKNEMLSAPYQQIAMVYTKHYEELSPQTINNCETIIPAIEKYNQYLSDDIKRNATGLKNKSQFISTYVKLGLKYPLDYINAFFQTNAGYLYVWDTSSGYLYTNNPEEQKGYLLTFTYPDFGVERDSKLKPVESILEYLFTYNNYEKIFLLRIICSYSIYIWISILCMFCSIDDKAFKFSEIYIFLALLFITQLLGPCTLVRYALPYMLTLPLLVISYQKYKHQK